MTTREGVIRGGQLVVDPPLTLPEGTRVSVRLETKEEHPLLYIAARAVSTGIKDLAAEHDHYAYGTPKRTE